MATTEGTPTYGLQLSEAERNRYRMMAARAVEQEAEYWRLAGIVPGARVADIGCGPGAVLVELARAVGDGGEAVGVEPDAAARAAAAEELKAAGVPQVRVLDGHGEATGLEPSVWDCVMIRHVLAHTGVRATRVLAHCAELLRPGGHLYIVDTFTDAFCTAPATPEIEGQMTRYAEFQTGRGNNLRIGPEVAPMMREVGLEVVDSAGLYTRVPAAAMAHGGPLASAQEAMRAAGALPAGEAEQWAEQRKRFSELPDAVIWVPVFLTIGRRAP